MGGVLDRRPADATLIRLTLARDAAREYLRAPCRPHGMRDEAFEREALPWLDDVYRFAFSLTRDEADAEDVVQDTFLRAFRSWDTYAVGSDCRRWLFTICRNAFLRSREREARTLELREGDADLAAAGTLSTHAASSDVLEEVLSRTDLLPAIETALARVPRPFQSALVLVDVEDQSYEAAAGILGIPIGTLRSRLFRGRRIMQELLVSHALDAGIIRST